jgi:hypothetical protein
LTNKMLIGLSDGSIKMLQYDTQNTQMHERLKNRSTAQKMSKVAVFKGSSEQDAHSDKITILRWIRLEIVVN